LWGGGSSWIGTEAPVTGSGFYLGLAADGVSKLIAAPKSTEQNTYAWGGYATLSYGTSTTNGVANTNAMISQGGHPAATYCKTLATGGYNTWYLPAKNELITMYSNKSATPFATTDAFRGNYHWSSTENNGSTAIAYHMSLGGEVPFSKNVSSFYCRAARRSTI
jgi:hypothetical protein